MGATEGFRVTLLNKKTEVQLHYLEIRPAEALTILPLFFPEAVPALYIGCMLANLGSPFLVYDVFIGSLATLLAALATWGVGKLIRGHIARVAVGGIFPVLFNAFCIPLIIVFLCDTLVAETAAASYWFFVGSLAATQVLWVYALGVPLYYFVYKMRKKGVSAFLDGKKQKPAEAVHTACHSQARKWQKAHRALCKKAFARPLHRGGYY